MRDAAEHFDQLTGRCGPVVEQRWFCIAGRPTRWSFSCRKLAEQLCRPLQHLEVEASPGPASLEVRIGTEAAREQPDPVFFVQSSEGESAMQILPRSTSALRFGQPPQLVALFQPAESLSLYELGRPLHACLTLWLNRIGAPLIHAGLVRFGERGVLIGGNAGRGKTSTALACLRGGGHFLSDDLTILECLNRRWVGFSLYGTTFLTAARRDGWSDILGGERLAPRYPWEEKTLTYLWPHKRTQLAAAAEIAAVVLPHPNAQSGRLSSGRALLGLAPSSILTGALSAGQRGFEPLVELVQSVPCYGLRWEPDMQHAVASLVAH